MNENKTIVISSEGSTEIWNLFNEVEREGDFRDLARSLYPVPPQVRDPHWLQCARSVAYALFVALRRRAEEEGETANNSVLVDFVQRHGLEGTYDLINEFDDLKFASTHINPAQERHAYSVFSTFQTTFSEVFYGDFAEAGDFSVREYVEDPRGRPLLLDMRSESEAPVFRLLVDWAIKNSLVSDNRRKYFLLDEFQQLPHLQNLGRLLNTGRYYKCQCLLGLQSIAQLQSKYGRTVAEGLLGGMPQVIGHRSGDRATVNFIRSKLGRLQSKKITPYDTTVKYSGLHKTIIEAYPFSEQEHSYLDTGEAIAVTPTKWSSPFGVWRLSESEAYLDSVYESVENPRVYVLPVRSDCDLAIRGEDGFKFERKDYVSFRRDLSVLVLGETGSGKTTTLKVLAYQQQVDPDEPRIVFDYKEDWKEFFLHSID